MNCKKCGKEAAAGEFCGGCIRAYRNHIGDKPAVDGWVPIGHPDRRKYNAKITPATPPMPRKKEVLPASKYQRELRYKKRQRELNRSTTKNLGLGQNGLRSGKK